MKRTKLLAIIAFALIGVSAVQAQSNSTDTWSKVTSANQLNGTWKGVTSSTQSIQYFYEGQGQTWSPELQQAYGNMNVKRSVELTIVMNASKRTGTTTSKETFTFSDGNINSVWSYLKSVYNQPGVVLNDKNHSVTYTNSQSNPMADSDLDGFQINQTGKKLKFSLTKLGVRGLPDDFVLTKQ